MTFHLAIAATEAGLLSVLAVCFCSVCFFRIRKLLASSWSLRHFSAPHLILPPRQSQQASSSRGSQTRADKHSSFINIDLVQPSLSPSTSGSQASSSKAILFQHCGVQKISRLITTISPGHDQTGRTQPVPLPLPVGSQLGLVFLRTLRVASSTLSRIDLSAARAGQATGRIVNP